MENDQHLVSVLLSLQEVDRNQNKVLELMRDKLTELWNDKKVNRERVAELEMHKDFIFNQLGVLFKERDDLRLIVVHLANRVTSLEERLK